MSEQWPLTKLSDHVDIAIGGTPSRAMPAFWADKPAGYPWLAISDLRLKYLASTREHISDLGIRSSNVKLIPPGTTVMSFKLSVGRTAITTQPMFSNEAIAAFLPRTGSVESAWLYHVLPMAAGTVVTDSAVKGATLNKAKMTEMTVSLPSPEEQRTIAQILDTLDTTIRQTEVIIDKLKQVKQGLLHDLLTRGIDANGELRSPQSQAPQLYKESALGWIPREWEAKTLNELVDQRRPIVYGILMPGYGHEGGVPVVKVKDIIAGSIQLDQLLLTSPAIDREYKRSRLKQGDLLFTIRGSVGRTAFVPAQLDDANITQDTARIGVLGCDARFVREYLAMPVPARFIATHTLGVAVQGINLRDVRRIPIAVPQGQEAEKIADLIEASNARITEEGLIVQKFKLAKSGLMDDLLTGRVRVTPLLDAHRPAVEP